VRLSKIRAPSGVMYLAAIPIERASRVCKQPPQAEEEGCEWSYLVVMEVSAADGDFSIWQRGTARGKGGRAGPACMQPEGVNAVSHHFIGGNECIGWGRESVATASTIYKASFHQTPFSFIGGWMPRNWT